MTRYRLLTALLGLALVSGCGDGGPTSDDMGVVGLDASTTPDATVDEGGDLGLDGGGDAGLDDSGALDAEVDGGVVPTDVVTLLTGSPATGFVDAVGTAARFSGPSGGVILPDRSALIIADTFNAVVRRVDLTTHAVTTIAGRVQVQATLDGVGALARFQSPRAMTVDATGTYVYLADGPTIRRLEVASGAVTTLAGTAGMAGNVDGTGPTVRLGFLLQSLTLSEDGEVLIIADRSNKTLRTLDLSTLTVSTIVGAAYTGAVQSVDGVGPAVRFSGLGGIARVGAVLFVADTFNHTVRRVDLETLETTTVVGVAGAAGLDDGVGAAARLSTPQAVVPLGGHLYSTSFDGVLRRISLDDYTVETILGDADDARSVDGVGPAARLGLAFAAPIPVPEEGVLYYQDRSASSQRRIELDTLTVTTVAGAEHPEGTRDGAHAHARFVSPAGLAASTSGNVIYATDEVAHTVRRIDRETDSVTTLAGLANDEGAADGAVADARFSSPTAIVLDAQGQRLFVADTGSGTIRTIDLDTMTVQTLAGVAGELGTADGALADARFVAPVALAYDATTDQLFVSEFASNATFAGGVGVIRVIDLDAGTVATVSGGARAAAPVDGPVGSATFNNPAAIALDAVARRLYVAESGLSYVRVVDLDAGTVSTLAGVSGESGPADGDFATARFDGPSGLALSNAGSVLFVSDQGANTMRRIDLVGMSVTTFIGDPSLAGGFVTQAPIASATMYFPTAPIVADGGLMWAGESAIYFARPAVELLP